MPKKSFYHRLLESGARRSTNVIDARDPQLERARRVRNKATVYVELGILRARAYDKTGDMKHLEKSVEHGRKAQQFYDLSYEVERGKGGPTTRRKGKKR